MDSGCVWTGAAKTLWQACHALGIITDDLVMPGDWKDSELIYRGLCRKDAKSKRRRIGTQLLLFTPFSVESIGVGLLTRPVRLSGGAMGSEGRCVVILYGEFP